MIGDFTGNWKESVKAVHKGGSRYEVELKLPQGKYVTHSFKEYQNLILVTYFITYM